MTSSNSQLANELIPLTVFVENSLKNPESIYSLSKEIAKAKFSLMPHEHMIGKTIYALNKLQESEYQTKEDRAKCQKLEALLLAQTESLTEQIAKVARVAKLGVEIEAIQSSRLDSVQLLTVLRQVPLLVQDVLEASLISLLEEIKKDLLSIPEIDNALAAKILKTKWFGRLQKIEISRLLNGILEELNTTLMKARVPLTENGQVAPNGLESGGNGSVTEAQFKEMMRAVPMRDSSVADSSVADANNSAELSNGNGSNKNE